MNLTRTIAQRIIEHINRGLHCNISVVDTSSIALASTVPDRVGKSVLGLQSEGGAEGDHQALSTDGVTLPLIYDDRMLGSIVVHDATPQAEEIAYVVKALAELIVHQAVIIEQLPREQPIRDKFIYDLLHGRLRGTLRETEQEASLLGIDLAVPRIVVLMRIEPTPGHRIETPHDTSPCTHRRDDDQVRHDLLHYLQEAMGLHDVNAYSFLDAQCIVGLLAVDPRSLEASYQRVQRHLQQLLDTLQFTLDTPLSAGIGGYYEGWQALTQSRRDAEFALDTGHALHGPGHAFSLLDLGLAAYVWTEQQHVKYVLAYHLLEPISKDVELFNTLEVFFQAELSPSLAAERLHIHRHTLAYRLDKIATLIGCDPRRFSDATQLASALLVWKLHATAEAQADLMANEARSVQRPALAAPPAEHASKMP